VSTPAPPPFVYDAGAEDPNGANLRTLLRAFDAAKSEVEQKQAELDAVKEIADQLNTQIKNEVTARFQRPAYAPPNPDGSPAAMVPFERYELRAPGLERPFVLRWQVTHRVNTQLFKSQYPDVYRAVTPGVGGWVLERKRGQ
jgi:hypothetical protein